MQPLVSVIMPVYNGEKFLKESLDSVLDQTFRDFELIVIDDGSVDASSKILEGYAERIVYLRQENRGFSSAVNAGISIAKGRYVAFIGQDDVYLPEKLHLEVQLLEEDEGVDLVHTPGIFIDEEGKELFTWGGTGKEVVPDEFRLLYTRGDYIIHPSVMVKREVLDTFRGKPFREDFTICSDFFLYLDLSRKRTFREITKPLVKIRKWEGRLSDRRELLFREEEKVLKEGKEFFSSSILIKNFMYLLAMSNQFLKESEYYFLKGDKGRALFLSIKAFIYFPFNFTGWVRKTKGLVRHCLRGFTR